MLSDEITFKLSFFDSKSSKKELKLLLWRYVDSLIKSNREIT